MPVVIHLGKGEVLEGKKTEPAQAFLHAEPARSDRLKDRSSSLSFHDFPGLSDYSTATLGPNRFLDNSQSLRLDCPPVLEPRAWCPGFSATGESGRIGDLAPMVSPQEKRRYPRVIDRLTLRTSSVEQGAAEMCTTNLSLGGAYVSTNRFIPPMTRVEILLHLPPEDGSDTRPRPVQAEAVVVRIDPP